jgi:hypothetical protein
MGLPINSQFGIKKETAWATPVVPDKFFEFDTETLGLDRDYYDGLSLRADTTFAPSSRTRALRRRAGGDVGLPVTTKQWGVFLDQMVSPTITPVLISGTAYKSTFNIGASVSRKSATLQVNKPTSQAVDTAFTYPGAVLTSAAFSFALGGVATTTLSWAIKDETTPSTTPAGAALATASYASGTDVWGDIDMSLTLNGSAAAAVTGASWTWNQPMATDRGYLDGSSTFAQPIPNGRATITGTLNVEWFDSTWYDLFRSGAFAALVVQGLNSTTAISGAVFPTFKNTFSAIQIRGSSPQVGGADLIGLDVPFVVKYDGANAPWIAEYTSSDSAAW